MSEPHIHHYVLHPTIIWDVTTFCNYRCIYCYSEQMPNRLLRINDRYPLEVIAQAFATHLPGWAIVYIGGEPFVYRDFAELNRRLAATNLIGIYSNLSVERNVERFVREVPPERVTFINCGLHIAERLRHDPDCSRFLATYKMLRRAGFRAAVTYIVHPSIGGRVRDDVQRFAEVGVKVYLKVFRGVYQGAYYPEAYRPDLLDLIAEHEPKIMRGEPVRAHMTGEGAACRAGMLLLDMDVEGNVYRCLTDRSLRRDCLGNLLKGTLRPLEAPTICRNEICLSARQGMGFTLGEVRSQRTPAALATSVRRRTRHAR